MLKEMLAAAGLAAGTLASLGAIPASAAGHAGFVHSCVAPGRGAAACNAILRTNGHVNPGTATPSGYAPSNLQAAYGLAAAAASKGAGQTVAIVDAYNDPRAASDLATYRSTFGLPACTTTNGCFRQVNQNGGTRLPTSNGGWAQEESLDLDMVSAICPNCHILLVEASNASLANLGAAVNEAVKLGATEVSNSYGGSDSADSSYYNHPGVAITASAGDSGYGVQYPASSQYVTSVGGTSLSYSGGVYSETAWNGTGSGCSSFNTQPSWQSSVSNITRVCAKRAVADVSADADPNTGVAVYDSYSYQGASGWLVFGGTSVASPIIASVYALAGNASATRGANLPYANPGALHDVGSGTNGSCGGSDLCTAGSGWDGPTGLGSPNGLGAF